MTFVVCRGTLIFMKGGRNDLKVTYYLKRIINDKIKLGFIFLLFFCLQKDFRAFFNYDVIIFIMYLRKCDEQIALLHTTLMENMFSLLR